MSTHHFFKTSMPPTRKAAYYLGCLDGSVFMDFNKDPNNRIYLQRISFDGYGCCTIEQDKYRLDELESRMFRKEMELEDWNSVIIELLVKKLIKMNEAFLPMEALRAYNLL